MQPLLILPFAFAGFRAALYQVVQSQIDVAAHSASSDTLRHTTGLLMRVSLEMGLNIVLFLAIVTCSGHWLTHQTAVTMICAVYAGSMLHAAARLISQSRLFYVIVNRHHLNLKRYIYAEIYRHAYAQACCRLDAMGGVRRLIYKACWGPNPDSIARRVAEATSLRAWHGVVIRLAIGLAICVGYVGVFRMIVAPFLIQQATAFTPLQAFLWPFAYACDHFAGTGFCKWVAALARPAG